MVNLAIYTRDTSGIAEFRGLQEWCSVAQFAEDAACIGPCETRVEEMIGWPDASVTWLLGTSCSGDTGYAVRP